MRRVLVLLFLLCGLSVAQQTVQVSVKYGVLSKLWNILLRPKLVVQDFSCVATEMEPGESTTCTITMSAPARAGGAVVVVNAPPGFTSPTAVVVAPGMTQATFTITRDDNIASIGPRVVFGALSWWFPGAVAEHHADVMIPCCNRADGCGRLGVLPCPG